MKGQHSYHEMST